MKFKLLLLLSTVVFFTFIVKAQEGGGFKFTKSTIDSGGGKVEGGGFTMTGSIAQPEANQKVTGGGYQLSSGFWAEGIRPDELFKNGFEN